METTTTNIGTWTAEVSHATKGFKLEVNGEFPTNGEKPGFKLSKRDPQGTVKEDLLLELNFDNVIDPNGSSTATVYYSEEIEEEMTYHTVSIHGAHSGSLIAQVPVKIPKNK